MSATKQVGRKASAKAVSAKGKSKVTKTVSAETEQVAVDAPRASIRQAIRSAILAGRSTAEITEVLTSTFPTSMAAQKAGKHISYYRSQLKKEAASLSA